ncbi:hypothetical protein MetexDRAFT_2385, partial [Methylorubrum extorquens DSM 13060]
RQGLLVQGGAAERHGPELRQDLGWRQGPCWVKSSAFSCMTRSQSSSARNRSSWSRPHQATSKCLPPASAAWARALLRMSPLLLREQILLCSTMKFFYWRTAEQAACELLTPCGHLTRFTRRSEQGGGCVKTQARTETIEKSSALPTYEHYGRRPSCRWGAMPALHRMCEGKILLWPRRFHTASVGSGRFRLYPN